MPLSNVDPDLNTQAIKVLAEVFEITEETADAILAFGDEGLFRSAVESGTLAFLEEYNDHVADFAARHGLTPFKVAYILLTIIRQYQVSQMMQKLSQELNQAVEPDNNFVVSEDENPFADLFEEEGLQPGVKINDGKIWKH